GVNEPVQTAAREQVRPSSRGPLRILIAGGSSGIGAAIAHSLAEQGHRIFICARRADRLATVAQGCSGIEAHVCDVSDEAQIEELIAAVESKTDALDVLVNCAGGFGEIGPVTIADTTRWWATLETNLKGTYLLIRHALPLLQKGDQPR